MDCDNLHGWIFIDKPKGVSSAKVVAELKKILKLKKNHKIGHGGTLDPLAEGMLPIAIGEATKIANYVLESDKTYEFTIQFGVKTDTKDINGKVLITSDYTPTYEQLLQAISKFTGEIEQIPPMYSAIKIDGQRAYALARKGVDINIPSRKINIYELILLDFDQTKKQAKLSAKVSKGTYIRSLAEDIAEFCGAHGHVIYLRRTSIGKYKEKLLISLNKIYNENDAVYENIISIEDMLDGILAYTLDKSAMEGLLQGNLKSITSGYPLECVFQALYAGKLIALLSSKGGELRFLRVFNH